MKSKDSKSVYDIITDKVITKLQEGSLPWTKPWKSLGAASNYISKKSYSGINAILLNWFADYDKPYFLTFNQIKGLGGHLKKGCHSEIVTFYKFRYFKKSSNGTGKELKQVIGMDRESYIVVPLLRYYNVFNINSVEGVELPIPELEKIQNRQISAIDACEMVIDCMPKKPELRHGGSEAFYAAKPDYVKMPEMGFFDNAEHYYCTMFHELIHSTGHPKRLDRTDLLKSHESDSDYAFEELVAELGAAFLCAHAGILYKTFDNSAAYLQGWIKSLVKHLQEDNKAIFKASALAQKATDYVTNQQLIVNAPELVAA